MVVVWDHLLDGGNDRQKRLLVLTLSVSTNNHFSYKYIHNLVPRNPVLIKTVNTIRFIVHSHCKCVIYTNDENKYYPHFAFLLVISLLLATGLNANRVIDDLQTNYAIESQNAKSYFDLVKLHVDSPGM